MFDSESSRADRVLSSGERSKVVEGAPGRLRLWERREMRRERERDCRDGVAGLEVGWSRL